MVAVRFSHTFTIILQHHMLSKPKRLQSEHFPLLISENAGLRPNFIALFDVLL